MTVAIYKLYARMQRLMQKEEGQDLIEYALVVALIALGATAGMSTVATDINQAFSAIGQKITTYAG